MAFSGVRSSCDTVATNSSFIRVARSASARAARSLSSSCSRSRSPAARSRSAAAFADVVEHQHHPDDVAGGRPGWARRCPRWDARCRRGRSARCGWPRPRCAPVRMTLSQGFSAGWRVSSLMMLNTSASGRPRASAAANPVSVSATGFTNVTMPLPVGGDDGIADARQRHALPFPLLGQRPFARLRSLMSRAIFEAPMIWPF